MNNPYDKGSLAFSEWNNLSNPRASVELLAKFRYPDGVPVFLTSIERVQVAVAIQFLACYFKVDDRFIKPTS